MNSGPPFTPFVTPSRSHLERINKFKRFFPVAEAFAHMSKYQGTKVGALILGPNFEVRSSGWNGAPRGSKADEDDRNLTRDERLYWASHAEANAIAQAARAGTALEGCTLICTYTPCMTCAKLIVQAGIKRVISPLPDSQFANQWAEDIRRTRTLFNECGIYFIEFDKTGN